MVRTAAEAVNNDVLAEYTARNNQALKELTEKHGVDVRRLPDDVLAELKRISDEKVQAMIGEDPLYGRIYESYPISTERDELQRAVGAGTIECACRLRGLHRRLAYW